MFCALPLPQETVSLLAAWQRDHLGEHGKARLVPAANLHVTLAFLGSTPGAAVPAIVAAMGDAAERVARPALRAERYRETRSVGMLVLADEGDRATLLAGRLAERLAALGVYEPERRPWLPHLTVLRFRLPDRPRLAPPVPDLGVVGPSEVALYHSVLRPGGAEYRRRESVALGG